ncbi:trimeric intracellular cation channel type 1B.1-like [Tachypleus tridentatus]|uniref:trimeric intracellular cation channel type 1B.1-like n=1 Tax=Tachypleus tridentatus TaxID=6853 RepID=UPI003FD0F8B3
MDPEVFLDLANQVTKLKMFPYFEAAHCAIVCMHVKEDLASGSKCSEFSYQKFCGEALYSQCLTTT